MTSPSTPRRLPTWREMNRDTDPQAEAVLFALWREMPVWRKIEILDGLIAHGRSLQLAGLRLRHPQASPPQLQRLLLEEVLGSELAAAVYGEREKSP